MAATLVFCEIPAAAVTNKDLERSSQLFSNHYGVWGERPAAKRPPKGARVRLSAAALQTAFLFKSDTCLLIQADDGDTLVGQAFVCRYQLPGLGQVAWITQLVVHKDYRRKGIGKKLCRMAQGGGDNFACGLVSCHPYAVRALEAGTGRTCNQEAARRYAADLLSASQIPYVQDCSLDFDSGKCLIDTRFFVDHTEVNKILSEASGWRLGPLEEGKEFFAFTFSDPR
ncbi:hypothetical protein WJX72_004259 [[Myrmecia] bisecta]|uniref:N-acetyltransferase domain-containing protein n=1 Tax=[Myrmecia] bisecta TaxID=41462 RepID=A0AAW1QQ82_9CHLO